MKMSTKELVTIAIGAALIAALSPLAIPIQLIPITLQTLAVGLVATVFPTKIAVLSVLIYLLLGGIGLPVFAGGSSGFQVLTGPSAGFLWGFPLYAAITSKMVNSKSTIAQIAFANLIGLIFVFLLGAGYFAWFTKKDLLTTLNMTVIPFIPGEALKIALISFTAPAIFRSLKQTDWYK